jgi:uncharacterized protein YkwD
MRPRLVLATLLSALAGTAAWFAPGAHATSYTPSSYASRVVSLVNETRQQHGLPSLAVTSGTSTVAQSWASHLASAQTLAHNPDLQHDLETHGSADWTSYGENVGEAPSNNADALFQAYMNSPEHRANILSADFRYVGVGVVFAGSTAWNTLDFVDAYRAATPKTTTTKSTTPTTTTKSTTPTTTTTAAPVHHAVTRSVTRHPVVTTVARPPAQPANAVTQTAPRRVPTRVKAVHAVVLPRKSMPEASVVAFAPRIASLAAPIHLPGPRSVTPLGELAVVAAAAMAGFVAVRWVAVVR